MASRSIQVYADTSVFGGVFDEEFSEASSVFFEQVRSGRFRLAVSPVVEEEVIAGPPDVRAFYESILSSIEMLRVSDEAVRLQEGYLAAGVVGPRSAADALHVAVAAVAGCQMIVSWNFRHIVHYDKIPLYNAISVRQGYLPIGIHTPQEVIHYEDQDV